MKNRSALLLGLVGVLLAHSSWAGFTPLDVRAGSPILDHLGATLPGSLTNFGCASAPGGLVQILQVGTGGIAHLPNLDGTPSGGDTILFTTWIGDYNGLNACTLGHQLDTAFTPSPVNGTKLFARVFDASTTNGATYWGQSATFTVNGSTVFDLSTAGLKATTMPKGVDPTTVVDAKGQTYYTDLIANLDPLNPNDTLTSTGLAGANSQVSVRGRIGRVYILQRSTDLSSGWTDITATTTGPLSADTTLTLTDPAPPVSTKVFYRVKVSMP